MPGKASPTSSPPRKKQNTSRASSRSAFDTSTPSASSPPSTCRRWPTAKLSWRSSARAKLPSGEPPDIIGIVVNEQGLTRALATPGVTTIGYPYSISAYFRRANANMSRAESRALVEKLQRETKAADRKLVVYISMAFGNPYEEPWGPEIVEDTMIWLKDIGVRLVSLADTVGTASPEDRRAGLQRREKFCRGRRDRRAPA